MTDSDLIIENIIRQIEGESLNEMAQWRQDKDFLSGWITPAEANEFIKVKIDSGEYARGEIKKSSMRWADRNDHSKGYLCRVVLAGEKASPKREYSQRTMKRRGLTPQPDAKTPSRTSSQQSSQSTAGKNKGLSKEELISTVKGALKDISNDHPPTVFHAVLRDDPWWTIQKWGENTALSALKKAGFAFPNYTEAWKYAKIIDVNLDHYVNDFAYDYIGKYCKLLPKSWDDAREYMETDGRYFGPGCDMYGSYERPKGSKAHRVKR